MGEGGIQGVRVEHRHLQLRQVLGDVAKAGGLQLAPLLKVLVDHLKGLLDRLAGRGELVEEARAR